MFLADGRAADRDRCLLEGQLTNMFLTRFGEGTCDWDLAGSG